MNQGVFGALTIAFESAAQKKAWLAAPLDTGRELLREASIAPEDSDLFGTQLTVKAKSLKAALEALTGMGFEVERRDVESWENVDHEGAPGIRVQTKVRAGLRDGVLAGCRGHAGRGRVPRPAARGRQARGHALRRAYERRGYVFVEHMDLRRKVNYRSEVLSLRLGPSPPT